MSNRAKYGLNVGQLSDVGDPRTPTKMGASGLEGGEATMTGDRMAVMPAPQVYNPPSRGTRVPEPGQTAVASISGESRPNETAIGTTVVGGIEAQHQAQSEQIADAATAKSDLAATKVLRAEKAKQDVAKNRGATMPSGQGRK